MGHSFVFRIFGTPEPFQSVAEIREARLAELPGCPSLKLRCTWGNPSRVAWSISSEDQNGNGIIYLLMYYENLSIHVGKYPYRHTLDNLVGGFKYFLFSPLLGEMIQLD